MKKLIIIVCSIVFLWFIFNNKNLKIIDFYQELDLLKVNTLVYKKDKKASYYKIFIYDENDNLLDIKKTTKNFYKLNFIRKINEKMYIKVISYNNNNSERKESKKYYLNWNLPFLLISDGKVSISNNNLEEYEIVLSKNNQKLKTLKLGDEVSNYENAEINLYHKNILINKYYLINDEESEVLYPLDKMIINPDDFYIKVKTNYNCLLTLKNKDKTLLKEIRDCEYLISNEIINENEMYELSIQYLYKDSYFPIKEEIINFETGASKKLLNVISNYPSGDVYINSKVKLLSPNNVDIYYTLDGTIPNEESFKYNEPISINEDIILNAIAISGDNYSKVSTLSYKAIEKAPLIYLSPSRQTQNLGVKRAGYSNEKIEMNKLADALERLLKKSGFRVYRAPQEKDLSVRTKESLEMGSDIYLALHSNASTSGYPKEGTARGIQSYIASPESNILPFAQIVQEKLMAIYKGPTNRSGVRYGTKTKMMYEINEENVKNGILLEIGFHDNYDDAIWIINNFEAIATSITLALEEYFQM